MALRPVFEELFAVGKQLGVGASYSVFSCRDTSTGQEYAVKIYDLPKIHDSFDEADQHARIKRELQILLRLDHIGIIKPFKIFSSPGHRLYLVMEMCLGGELTLLLSQFHGRLPEDLTRVLMVQVVSAIGYVHSLGIVHRDLKLENILLLRPYQDDAYPLTKIADFGFARYLSSPEPAASASTRPISLSFLGTFPYAAPEIINRQQYDCRCDMFSVGVILYRCLVGSLPPLNHGSSELELEPVDFHCNSMSKPAQDLVSRLLIPEQDRFSAEEFLFHPWCQL